MMRHYHHARAIRLDAVFSLAARGSLILASGLFLLSAFARAEYDAWVMLAVLVSVALWVADIGVALSQRCPVCMKRPSLRGVAPLHPEARQAYGLLGDVAQAWGVLRRRRFVCLHCGTAFQLDERA